jgi:acetyl esterase/lipase
MKPSGKILLIVIAVVALGAGAAVLLHLPASQPLLAHLHQTTPASGAPGADTGARSAATARALAGVAAIGSRWDAAAYAETVSLYTAVHRELDWPGLLDPETITYGPDPEQNLDLFRPEQDFSEPGPVFVFVHGNGLGADDWRIQGSEGLLLAHAGRVAATAGGLGVLMNYRTGEAANAASGAEDLRLVIDWIRSNIAPYGGDPETIVVLAHSEGALLTATYLYDEQSQLASGSGIAAAVLSSGTIGDAALRQLAALVDDYRGDPVPLALWRAGFDTAQVRNDTQALYEQLCDKFDDCPWLEQFDGHNHMSQIFSFGTDDGSVMNAFIRFYHTVR